MPTKPISSVSMTIRSGDILSSSSSSSRLLFLVIPTYLCPLHHTAFTGQVYDRFFSSQDNTHAHTHTYAMFCSTIPDSTYLAPLEASASAAVAVSSSSGVSKPRKIRASASAAVAVSSTSGVSKEVIRKRSMLRAARGQKSVKVLCEKVDTVTCMRRSRQAGRSQKEVDAPKRVPAFSSEFLCELNSLSVPYNACKWAERYHGYLEEVEGGPKCLCVIKEDKVLLPEMRKKWLRATRAYSGRAHY